MDNLGWGLEMTLLGMGTVFLLLILLMIVLLIIGWLDAASVKRQQAAEEAEAARKAEAARQVEASRAAEPQIEVSNQDGLTTDQIAAIGVALLAHTGARRRNTASHNSALSSGEGTQSSPWVAAGRSAQMRSTTRR